MITGVASGQDSWDCDPDGNFPKAPPPAGCKWEYEGSGTFYAERHVLVSSSDIDVFGPWDILTNCACGWYPETVPCPTCPPDPITKSITDTGTWSITTGTQQAAGFTLRSQLFADVGFSYTLTVSESQSLSATHTETSTITLNRQKILCFDRFYRERWVKRTRTRKMYFDWTYTWRAWCNEIMTGTTVTTQCSQLVASGTFTWNGYPQFEWAPQKPPCGGVPIQTPDPWGGKREVPCWACVCSPPPPPEHPCCGCEVGQ